MQTYALRSSTPATSCVQALSRFRDQTHYVMRTESTRIIKVAISRRTLSYANRLVIVCCQAGVCRVARCTTCKIRIANLAAILH